MADKKIETKRERFVRIAEARTNKIIEMLRLLGNCSSKASYKYSDDDVKKIFMEIEKELKNAKARFQSIENDDKKFKL